MIIGEIFTVVRSIPLLEEGKASHTCRSPFQGEALSSPVPRAKALGCSLGPFYGQRSGLFDLIARYSEEPTLHSRR